MKRKMLTTSVVVLALALTLAWAQEPSSEQTPKKVRTLDEMTRKVETVTRPDGTTVTTRVATEFIPWDEFVVAFAAATDGTDPEDTMAKKPPEEPASTPGVCIPPDEDYDGDGFIGADDSFPEKRGEYVADRPRIVATPFSNIEMHMEYSYSGSSDVHEEDETLYVDDLNVHDEVKYASEVTKKFNGTLGISLSFSLANLMPTFGLDLQDTSLQYTYKKSREWKHDVIRDTQNYYRNYVKKTNDSLISWDEDAGQLTGQIKFINVYDGGYGRNVILTEVTVHVVSYSPYTGAKYWVGSQTFSGPYELLYGLDVNYKLDVVQLEQMSTWDTVKTLADARVFDFELADWTAIDKITGENINDVLSLVNQRTARLSIHYGDDSDRYFGQVSLYQPDDNCLTAKAMLETVISDDQQLAFERMADGTLVVSRINHRSNVHADQDFWTLTEEEKAEYGRWVVGYDFGPVNPATQIDLENTFLATDDVVFFYYLTAADFEGEEPLPDETNSFTIANDGSYPSETIAADSVSTMDLVELEVDTSFEIYNTATYTQYVGNIWSPNCGSVYGATWHGHRVLADSSNDPYPVPDADFYGLEFKFGGMEWTDIETLMDNETAMAEMLEFGGYPTYHYKVRFRATPELLGDYPERNFQVRNVKPQQNLRVGYTGYDVMGRAIECFYYLDFGFFENDGNVSLTYKIDKPDLDLDGFYSVEMGGLDFDDANNRRFPYAPEHLDGIDNDGDDEADEEPLLCPDAVLSNTIGTCALDDRMGWYGDSPNIGMEQRWHYLDGSTGSWETVGSIIQYPFVMSDDPDVSGLEVKAINWGAPEAFEGSNFIERTDLCVDTDSDGWTTCAGDCDDTNPNVYPGAPELCDGLDNNCDSVVPSDEVDADWDSYRVCDGDCNDGNHYINPGMAENCLTPYDDNCDGYINEGCGGGSPIFRKPNVHMQDNPGE